MNSLFGEWSCALGRREQSGTPPSLRAVGPWTKIHTRCSVSLIALSVEAPPTNSLSSLSFYLFFLTFYRPFLYRLAPTRPVFISSPLIPSFLNSSHSHSSYSIPPQVGMFGTKRLFG